MKIEQLGPYRIVKQIGKGGMGAVYEAVCDDTGPDAGERVAIKALSPQLAMAEGFRERFEAEIDSLKKLKHDGIVRLYGYGEQDGVLFYSMELVEGSSLEEELNSGRKFDWRETLQIGIQICRALKHAHDHGVVHRDIKPANLMLTADKQIKIADFGIARLFGGTQLTTAGGVLGTADYMSPEQADGRPVTEKCDQYSLGGVMYALLAGRPPFRAKTMPEMLQLQRFAEPEPVRRYAVETPDQLDRLIMQLLAKEPTERFPNVLVLSRHMEAMAKALARKEKEAAATEQAKNESPAAVAPSDATIELDDASTRELDAPLVVNHETTSIEEPQDMFDAPTLAQPSDSTGQSSATAPQSSPSTGPDPEPTHTTHYTTVDEDARRQRELSQTSPLVMASQLGGLLAALGVLLWGGWQLMKPPTADALFAQINESVQQEGIHDLSRDSADAVEAFFQRFPDDTRTSELQPLKEQLEFQKYERQARARSKFSGMSGLKPIEKVYFESLHQAEKNPSAALEQLRALVTLYDPGGQLTTFEVARSKRKLFQELGDPRLLVVARRRIEQISKQLEAQAAKQLPVLEERLAQARRLAQRNPAVARGMYEAIVTLYDGPLWAREAVTQAKQSLAELSKQ